MLLYMDNTLLLWVLFINTTQQPVTHKPIIKEYILQNSVEGCYIV